MSTGRVIHTGQAVVDLVLRVPAVPAAGGDVFASGHEFLAGGGVNVMLAAARDGARVVYAGGHGTGPFGDVVRAALAAEDVELTGPADPGIDTGFSVALVDDDAERTFVSTAGAEGAVDVARLRGTDPGEGDVVYASGYSLVHDANRAALLEWLPTVPAGCTVVVDPAPVIGDVDLDAVRVLLDRADVWTTNEQEALILLRRLGSEADGADAATALATATGRTVVLRAGSRGALLARPGQDVVNCPAPEVEAVDTNGAGDAHAGVMCARLAAGEDLPAAVRRASVAAAIAVTRSGPATAPTTAEIDTALRDGTTRRS
ncbi:PfkB family carbohydrate kinase [Saccharopolyspora gloriosae]|uniref:Sugar/nucleoside kinase (Ribokinase family) n=1 Tax=Saccharopolyspora gloriosae TaxID=455344 RepID=A0A840NG48_9PSEU|nr:PfkB family carbohydrate kinase [Saccharopolyspora gloriosae]MBB5070564.1 sugar/nucleoside kinase (ribokinase family) [Saccharopolyspora gloriosae]